MFFESTPPHQHAIAATHEGSSRPRAPEAPGVRGESSRWNPSVRGPEVSLGAPRVATRRAQAPTPHARRLPSVHTYKQGPLRSTALDHDLPKFWIQSSLENPKHRRMRRRRLPDPRPIPERVRGPIYPKKKCVSWTRWRPVPVKNVNYPRPPVVAVAASLDPILPHR